MDAAAREQIELLFQQHLYIPVIRTDDCIRVGRPEDYSHLEEKTNVQAVAGPLSPPQARDLYQYLRSPHRQRNTLSEARLSDQSKGVERIARIRCREMGVEWIEWWPFLKASVDLSTRQGLDLLEQHLRSKHHSPTPDQAVDMSELQRALANLDLSEEADERDEIFVTAPSSPVPADVFVEGNQFSEWDKNAFLALEHAHIDGGLFPHVAKWHERVSELMKDYSTHVTPLKNRRRFATPARLAFTP